jgi:hypothetical protein
VGRCCLTFFPQEEAKNRKLVPALLGITAKGILKCDPKTRQVIREWPIEQMAQWEGVQGRFTFDFGANGGENGTPLWTVLTGNLAEKIRDLRILDETDAIATRIRGYIQLILESRKLGAQVIEIDQPTALAVEEDSIKPQFAQVRNSELFFSYFFFRSRLFLTPPKLLVRLRELLLPLN